MPQTWSGPSRSCHDKCCSEVADTAPSGANSWTLSPPYRLNKPGGQRCYALSIAQRRSLRIGRSRVHFLPTFLNRGLATFGVMSPSAEKPKIRPTRAKAARRDDKPTPDALANLLPRHWPARQAWGQAQDCSPTDNCGIDAAIFRGAQARKSTPKNSKKRQGLHGADCRP